MMDSYDEDRLQAIMEQDVDWERVHQQIEAWRVVATGFLETSISGG
jgi:hypothetical protein